MSSIVACLDFSGFLKNGIPNKKRNRLTIVNGLYFVILAKCSGTRKTVVYYILIIELFIWHELFQNFYTVLRRIAPQNGTECTNAFFSLPVICSHADIPDVGP